MVIRTAGWARALAAAVVAGCVGTLVLGDPPDELLLFLCALLAAATLVLLWSARVSAVATADGRLVVRNLTGTLTVPRDHVGSIEIDDAGPSSQLFALFVRTHEDLRLRLDATLWPFPTALDRTARELRTWRDGRPEPFA
ncbi:hypothetical protein [Blastococcus litoris]|uniref:hypothetical protein n=1 Tax=Blastococcus litoris TaxID=2171622 RepID=UPI000E30915A|nr:hypothetical protein [Blastococcus litoris]